MERNSRQDANRKPYRTVGGVSVGMSMFGRNVLLKARQQGLEGEVLEALEDLRDEALTWMSPSERGPRRAVINRLEQARRYWATQRDKS